MINVSFNFAKTYAAINIKLRISNSCLFRLRNLDLLWFSHCCL